MITTEDEDLIEELDEEETEEELEEDAEEGSDDTDTEEDAEGAPGQEEEEQPQADPRDDEIASLKSQVRQMNGRVGEERGHKVMLNKIIKHLEQKEGAVDRDDIAAAVGIDRNRLDGILDAQHVDDNEAFNQRCNVAERNIKAVKAVLKTAGKDADDIIQTYGTLLNVSHEERELFMSLPEDELVAHMIEATSAKGGKVKRLRESKGNVLEALSSSEQRIAELEAENAALRSGKRLPQSKKERVPLNNGGRAATPRPGGGMGEAVSKVLG